MISNITETILKKKFNGLVEPLQEAINLWNKAENYHDKKDYLIAIGEIGNIIHKNIHNIEL